MLDPILEILASISSLFDGFEKSKFYVILTDKISNFQNSSEKSQTTLAID